MTTKIQLSEKAVTLDDISSPGVAGTTLPDLDVPQSTPPPDKLLRSDLDIPEISEPELVRYFTRLSQLNFGIDTGFYPLGSCTMKYNPKWHEEVARFPGFAQVHPLQDQATVQGALAVMHGLQEILARVTGASAVSLAPLAGAHGEMAGLLMIRAYHRGRGEDHTRRQVLIPDTAHGTNAASGHMCGYDVVTVPSDSNGNMDLEALARMATPQVAGLMLTLPSTLGLFDPNILDICRIVHDCGGLVYGDGANLNAILGRVKLGELGFDVVHTNLHKTFSTPHGGGGPGAGPVCAADTLAPFLPAPVVYKRPSPSEDPHVSGEESGEGAQTHQEYYLGRPQASIGKISVFHCNFGVVLRAYAYIRLLGEPGLREISENAVINANYIMTRLKDHYALPYHRIYTHEVVFSASRQKALGVSALDISKRLMDYGFHPPTMYFPMVVPEALMIEPTECESMRTLDTFIHAMKAIAHEAETDPDLVKNAPHTTPLSRLDEATAARHPNLHW
ncbi:MAG: aminomethyl-transferring glycine dehydrogenase subunit GcvPB [Chloroflexi bacterium]|nr:aminomethyl-transferring glycine dehydrogenase subunit GcvPB [Chloroflexota bacterium]